MNSHFIAFTGSVSEKKYSYVPFEVWANHMFRYFIFVVSAPVLSKKIPFISIIIDSSNHRLPQFLQLEQLVFPELDDKMQLAMLKRVKLRRYSSMAVVADSPVPICCDMATDFCALIDSEWYSRQKMNEKLAHSRRNSNMHLPSPFSPLPAHTGEHITVVVRACTFSMLIFIEICPNMK